MDQHTRRVYKGFSEDTAAGTGPVAVLVEYGLGSVKRLRHQIRHSSAGLGWGYGGSGAADLARSILADHLGYIPHPAIYQQFKWQHVARWEQGKPWQITAAEIQLFLSQPGIRQ